MVFIYRVVGLPREDLNGREVRLNTQVDNPNLIFLRKE